MKNVLLALAFALVVSVAAIAPLSAEGIMPLCGPGGHSGPCSGGCCYPAPSPK